MLNDNKRCYGKELDFPHYKNSEFAPLDIGHLGSIQNY